MRGVTAAEDEGDSKWRAVTTDGVWTAVTDVALGVGVVKVIDDSTLQFDYIRTSTGVVYDSIVLTRDHSQFLKV